MFMLDIWYVAGWSSDVTDAPVGVLVAGEPIVIFRDSSGALQALQNRCPHRHAALSEGRIEDDEIRCLYHGLRFNTAGQCTHVPGTDRIPAEAEVRVFPVVERDGWIWVWPGRADRADAALIPEAWGLEMENCVFETGAIDYDADYQLVNDNLTDLSHVDFVHETTLSAAGGVSSSEAMPSITKLENGVRFERWWAPVPAGPAAGLELWNTVDYLLPGIFLMKMEFHPPGTFEATGGAQPTTPPIIMRCEQQAVTPTIEGKCRYLFASGAPVVPGAEDSLSDTKQFFAIAMAAFAEDKQMIEAQQRIIDVTPDDVKKVAIPQDRGPTIIRRMIHDRLREEAERREVAVSLN